MLTDNALVQAGRRRRLTPGYEGSGGNFAFDPFVLPGWNVCRSHGISDHYPLWVEFPLPPPD